MQLALFAGRKWASKQPGRVQLSWGAKERWASGLPALAAAALLLSMHRLGYCHL